MTNNSNNSKANTILILISVVAIVIAAFSGVGYTLSKSDFTNKIAIEKQRTTKQKKENKVALLAKQDQIDSLKTKINGAENNTTQSADQNIDKDSSTVINEFINVIISNRGAKQMRSDLKDLATLNVIQQIAPENVNEKYDNPGQQSKKTIESTKIYKNTDQDSHEYYVVYNYSIGEQKLKTRLVIQLGVQKDKTVITKAQYDMQNTANDD